MRLTRSIRSFCWLMALGFGLAITLSMGVNLSMVKAQDDPTPAIETAVIEVISDGLSDTAPTPTIGDVMISGDYALVTWNLGDMGGQALLQHQEEGWQVLTHGGGALDAATLQEFGVPAAIANDLAPF